MPRSLSFSLRCLWSLAVGSRWLEDTLVPLGQRCSLITAVCNVQQGCLSLLGLPNQSLLAQPGSSPTPATGLHFRVQDNKRAKFSRAIQQKPYCSFPSSSVPWNCSIKCPLVPLYGYRLQLQLPWWLTVTKTNLFALQRFNHLPDLQTNFSSIIIVYVRNCVWLKQTHFIVKKKEVCSETFRSVNIS